MSPLHDSGCRRNGKEARGADLLSLLGNLQHYQQDREGRHSVPSMREGSEDKAEAREEGTILPRLQERLPCHLLVAAGSQYARETASWRF